MNKPDESALSVLEEDQLLEIVSDRGHGSIFETTSNFQMFWINVKAEILEISQNTDKLASISFFFFFQSLVFCSNNSQNKTIEYPGLKQHILNVPVSCHSTQDCLVLGK